MYSICLHWDILQRYSVRLVQIIISKEYGAEMKQLLMLAALATSFTAIAEESMLTPADMPEEDQHQMYGHIMEYNKCMMHSRLSASTERKEVQKTADDILKACETHLDDLKALLSADGVNEALAMGMTKKLRSKAARDLMTKSMNNMAAQASAVINAEKIKAEQTAQ